MKICSAVLMTFLSVAPSLWAQVSVEIVLDQEQYLPAEQLLAGIRIVNHSGQTLHLGEDMDWARFSVEKLGGGAVQKLSEPPVQGGFDLESTKRATMKVDLAPSYDLREPGRYLISASVKIKEWNKMLTAKPVPFDIIEGTKLWEQAVGLPRSGETSQPPEVRKYTLQEAKYLKQLRLYLRISASDGRVLKLINVGPMISFGQPEPMVDSQSRLHVLYQNGARNFSYLMVNPDGEVEIRQSYEYTESRPRLRLDDSGKINVVGGSRRLTAADLPATTETKTNAASLKP